MIDKRTAIVTGGAKGIGNAIAQELAKDGCAIVIFDIIPQENVKENLELIKDSNVPLLYIQGNLADRDDRKRLVDTVIKEFGRIDILVNNAGVAPKERKDILEMTEESFDFVMGINLKGTLFLTQLVAKEMIRLVESGINTFPVIINISSISAYTSSTNRGEYCISKAGVSMLTKLFADRLADYGIYVYEIRPGIILTDMTSVVKEKYDKLIAEGITPIKRWGYPQDIANAVSVLCSGKLSFSTGEVINVDGGFHLRRL
ncbi:MAG: 3-ketoacyl-ACP reductase [bacterium]|nr:3-ketoacyl-ACP reductase [bacterium]